MSSLRIDIPDIVRDAQARASQPVTSVFVAANAGSGKTHVLVNRVIRLLLQGTSPEKILCITFTKAAAANMSERVFTKLGRWVTLPDGHLDQEMREAGEAKPNAHLRDRARKLFACALETPGGLKVQTIHALCTRLLQQFPFEAKVPAHFSVLDERDQDELMERANIEVLTAVAGAPGGHLGRALTIAMENAADMTFKDVVREACFSRDQFLASMDGPGDLEAAMTQVASALGISVDERAAEVGRNIVDGPHLPKGEWTAVADILATGSKTDASLAECLREATAMEGRDRIDTYLSFFVTGSGTPRKSLMTKALVKEHPDLAARLEREQARVLQAIEELRALDLRDRTGALLTIAKAVSDNYRRKKRERGLLDYDDLIDRTLALLNDGASGWVHFKLDRGVDHVLIDEAQDTSPKQWDIIQKLIEEFWSGAGARDAKRTVFAVGDEKQSIFSFQGAAPREFDLRRRELKKFFDEAKLAFESVNLQHSFRSGQAILDAVDAVFHDAAIYQSIQADKGRGPVHNALTGAPPALIDLWNLEEPTESENEGGWSAPLDALPESSPEAILAGRVQKEISALIAGNTMTGAGSRRRRISYGDILILVRRRGTVFDAVIQALKHANIPIAGADRLKLTEHIAVIDLMNLADALLHPSDDLALAVALKSPLFGLDDKDLLTFAPLREGSLREALQAGAGGDGRLKAAFERLVAFERRVAGETPFSFFAWLLGSDGGRALILKRLGPEANDALDEFLELALTYERKEAATLQGFMAWLRAAETEIKRDMEIRRDEVRVMTVHGAKGLEASVVFLVDTTTAPADTQRKNLIRLPQGNGNPHSPAVVVWAGKKSDDTEVAAAAREEMKRETEDEYRRLLYVAMTRAADRLIVGGILPGNRNAVRELSWYDMIAKGLETSALVKSEIEGGARYRRADDVEPPAPAIPERSSQKPVPLPDWLRLPAPAETPADVQVRPSDSQNQSHSVVTAESLAARANALLRGTLIHRLLQSLPDVAPEQRAAAAEKFLSRNAANWKDGERASAARQVLSIIEQSEFAALFETGSRAEVSVVGRIAREDGKQFLVSGQIDRLTVTADEVLIVDYKTNHAPPSSIDGAPLSYIRQLALYRAVLTQLYPGKRIRCALLWTETASIMEIPSPALDAELQSIAT
ncbi:MAG: double-strand break repair helicase AddA [Pseudomonadota bacterium]